MGATLEVRDILGLTNVGPKKSTQSPLQLVYLAEQGFPIATLDRIWSLARAVWGSDEATRDFLFRQHQLLDGRRPIDVAIKNELGGELVREILGRLQNGSSV